MDTKTGKLPAATEAQIVNWLIGPSEITHVSLLPPPCDELTTSEPLRNATRVRPPGTMVTPSP